MNIVGGLDRPDSGVFLYEGENVPAVMTMRMSRYRNQVIGFIFQNFNLDPSLTALENVVMPLMTLACRAANAYPWRKQRWNA